MKVYETMWWFPAHELTVRLWISGWDQANTDAIVESARNLAMDHDTTGEVAAALSKIPGINAVEVLSANGNGHLWRTRSGPETIQRQL